jgi:ATPase family associated with various cellular activities (AAA)
MSNARELRTFLTTVAKHQNKDSVMLWGAPGIGKSSVVAQVATENNLLFTDVRISQMMPGDLRGLPAADIQNDCFRYLAPNFLPKERSAPGILFLDEITQAPPTVQAIAQQLILDRKVGDYCYDAETRVMTKTGLKYFYDLKPSDQIMTLNPTTNLIEYHEPSEIIALDYAGEMLHFKAKGLSLNVSPNHNMYVRADWENKPKFVKAKDLATKISKLTAKNSHYRVKRNGDWSALDPQTFTLAKCTDQKLREDLYVRIAELHQQKVPVAAIASTLNLTKGGVEARLYYDRNPKNSYMPAKTFDLGDWAEFMGWYIAEGCVSKEDSGHNRITICQSSTANAIKYKQIQELLTRMGFVVQCTINGLVIHNKSLCEYLRPLGKQLVRYVPQEVKDYPKYALKRFIQAVLLGDGDSERRLYTTSLQLRDDYCEIAIKLGYAVTFSSRAGSGFNTTGSLCWIISLSQTAGLESSIAKVESTQYNGKIYCVTVPNHILMVERDGKLAWCGNCLPDNWFIWAAGNRQQDKTGVYAMPTALANRFNHIEVTCNFDTWKLDYALANIAPEVVAFLSFRPNLLHKMDVGTTAWPSPRSWAQASRLHEMGLTIDPAVGVATQAEFSNFLVLYKELPDLDLIIQGKGNSITWPTEVSLQYAVTEGLLGRSLAATGPQLMNIVHWMSEYAGVEYSNKFFSEIMDLGFERVPNLTKLMAATSSDPKVLAVVQKMNALQSYSY